MSDPKRLGDSPVPGESAAEWFHRTFGPMPAPVEIQPKSIETIAHTHSRRASDLLERSIPTAYGWCHLDAAELPQRVYVPAIGIGKSAWHEPRICLMGLSRTGKTSLAVAMLRAWVAKTGRRGTFIPAHRLGVSRLQHPAGHGEPEVVETAMKAPLVLIDDVGSERDFPSNPLPDVIFERHAAERPTWITTGLTREQLVTRYGLGVVARLFERARVIRLGSNKSSSVEK